MTAISLIHLMWLSSFSPQLVVSTKIGLPLKNHVINSAGNHRKSLLAAVDDSLSRLRTSYIVG